MINRILRNQPYQWAFSKYYHGQNMRAFVHKKKRLRWVERFLDNGIQLLSEHQNSQKSCSRLIHHIGMPEIIRLLAGYPRNPVQWKIARTKKPQTGEMRDAIYLFIACKVIMRTKVIFI